MLDWPNQIYKLTLGAGALAMVGMMGEFRPGQLPVWAVIAVALGPFIVFVFVKADELPPRVVRFAHVGASLWYVAEAIGLLVTMAGAENLPRGWPVYPFFLAIGAVPCAIVLYRAMRGRYLSQRERLYAWRSG
jgi:hypothetical protein